MSKASNTRELLAQKQVESRSMNFNLLGASPEVHDYLFLSHFPGQMSHIFVILLNCAQGLLVELEAFPNLEPNALSSENILNPHSSPLCLEAGSSLN